MRTTNIYASLTAGFLAASSLTGCRMLSDGGKELPAYRASLVELQMDEVTHFSQYLNTNQNIFIPDPKGGLWELKSVLGGVLRHANEFKSRPLHERSKPIEEKYAIGVMRASINTYKALRRISSEYGPGTRERYEDLALSILSAARGELSPSMEGYEGKTKIYLRAYDVMANAIRNNPNPIRLNRELGDILPDGKRMGDNMSNLLILAGLQTEARAPDISKVQSKELKKSLSSLVWKISEFDRFNMHRNAKAIGQAVQNVQKTYMTTIQAGQLQSTDQTITLDAIDYARNTLATHVSNAEISRIYQTINASRSLIANLSTVRDTTPFRKPPTLEDFIKNSKPAGNNAPTNASPVLVVPPPKAAPAP